MQNRRLSFSLRGLMLAVTGLAIYASLIAVLFPSKAGPVFAVTASALAVIFSIGVVPERHAAWVRPVVALATCIALSWLGFSLR
jgi:hypothetical protein